MKRYTEPPIKGEVEGYAQGGRKRRRRGGAATGMMARPRLDQRPRKAANGAPASKDLPAPAGDLGAPLPEAPEGTRPSTPLSVDDAPQMMKRGGAAKKWIQGAIKHPGALHEQLHVPQGEKIPEAKLEKASHSSDPTLRRRANLAETLKGFH